MQLTHPHLSPSGIGWQCGHQKVTRASGPWMRLRIGSPQRAAWLAVRGRRPTGSRSGSDSMRGAALPAAVGHDRVAGSSSTLAATSPVRARDQRLSASRASSVAHLAERVDRRHKTDLRLEDVAHAGQHFLVQQHIGNLFVRACASMRRTTSPASKSALSTSIAGGGMRGSRASSTAAVCIFATGTRNPTAM